MKVVIVYREHSESDREVSGWLQEFEYRTGKRIESVDPDSRDGISFCRVNDIIEYPTIIAIDNAGKMQNLWRGLPLPLINEVSYYVQ